MRRLHLFEIMDQAWCPAVVRDAMTDYLQFAERQARVYIPIAGRLQNALKAANTERVIDLGSGAGGPWESLYSTVATGLNQLSVTLTDYHPNKAQVEAWRGKDGAFYYPESVDATAVPAHLVGFRTMFSSFHHFRPEQAREILADAIRNGQGIGVFEVTERQPLQIISLLIVPIIATLLVTPLLRPVRLSRFLLTYLIPIVPLAIGWDGFVSSWRTYTTRELRTMVEEIPGSEAYTWEIGQEAGPGMLRVTYLIGYPQSGDRNG